MKNTAFYGKTQNAKELFAMPHVNGGLIGGASLDVGKFTSIMKSAK